MTQTLAQQIRSARETRGWTQEQLAVHADVSRSTIQNLENGRRQPHRGSLRRIADALGLDVATLTSVEEAPPVSQGERPAASIGDLSEVDDLDAIEDQLKAALAEIDRLRRERERLA